MAEFSLEDLAATEMSQEHLGDGRSFRELENCKREFIDFASELRDYLQKTTNLDSHYREATERETRIGLNRFKELHQKATTISSPGGVSSDRQFSDMRKDVLATAKGHVDTFVRETEVPRLLMKQEVIQQNLDSMDLSERFKEIDRLTSQCRTALEEVTNTETKAGIILSTLQDKVERKTIEDAAEDFNKLSTHHRKHEIFWACVLGVASVALLVVIAIIVYNAWNSEAPSTVSAAGVISDYLIRILALTFPAILMRVALTKYNVERNLRVIFSHRNTALSQYKLLKDSLEGNREAQDQLLLEVTRLVFTDPATGMTKTAAGEINISPVLSTIGKAASGS